MSGLLNMMRWNKTIGTLIALLVSLAGTANAQDHFKELLIGSRTYTNAEIVNRTTTDIYVRHAGGLVNLKLASLDDASLIRLGYQLNETDSEPAISFASLQENPQLQAVQKQLTTHMEGTLLKMDQTMVAGLLVAGFVLYLFLCYCSMLVCRNAGSEPGMLIWIPVLQMFPLLKAARMPAWWFLLFLLPVINLLASILWCLKIAQACGKSALTGILLLLPVIGFLAFLYLAFSSGNRKEETLQPIRLSLSEG